MKTPIQLVIAALMVACTSEPKTPAASEAPAGSETSYRTACAAGDAKGCSELVRMGGGNAAVEPLRKACQSRELYGCNALSLALGSLRYACDEDGHLRSCANLGVHFMEFTILPTGLGPANVAVAEALLRKACDGGDMLGCTSLGVLPIDLCINLPDEEGWRLYHTAQVDNLMLTTAGFVRGNETAENWTEIIRVTRYDRRSPAAFDDLEAYPRLEQDQSASVCEEGWHLKVMDREPMGGVSALVYLTRCKRLSQNSHHPRTDWGHPETKMQLLVADGQYLYNVIRTRRASELDERSVGNWAAFLKNVRLCGTPIPVQLSKAYEREHGEQLVGVPLESAMMKAAEKGDTAALQSLLAAGADVNTKDESGMTALMLAAAASHPSRDAVDVLLAAGADLEAQSDMGGTALNLAALMGRAAIVGRLLAAGADVDAKSDFGTALMLAAGAPDPTAIARLLEAGADVNARTDRGVTALMVAVWLGPTATIERLLEAGADVNARTDGGATALMMTGSSINQAIVELLLGAGADAKDSDRIAWLPNALDGSPDLVQFMREGVVGVKEPHQKDPAAVSVDVGAIYECMKLRESVKKYERMDRRYKKCYGQLTEVRPGVLGSYRTRGIYSYNRGNYREAIADYTRAIELNPNDLQALENRGVAHEKLGMNEEAAADRRRVNELR